MISALARAVLVVLLLPGSAALAASAQEANDAYTAAKALSDKAAANKIGRAHV